MRELLFSLVVTAALVVAAPMEPYDHGHVWQGSVNPYLTPSQGEGMPQWQQYPNVAPTFYVPPSGHASDSYHASHPYQVAPSYHVAPTFSSDPNAHVSGPHSIQPSWVPDAGASAPSSSSFDTQGTFFSPQDYNRWEHSMTSSTDVPAAPHWSGPNLQDASRGWSHAIDSEMDRAILNGVMQDLRHHKSTSSVPTTPLHLDEDAFVASLLSDSPSRNELEHAREYEHHQEHAFLPTMIGPNAVSGSSLQGYQLVPGTDLTGMSRSEYQEWNRQVKQERTRSRLRRGWPEPSSFHRFNWLPSWSGRRNVMINTQVQDAHVRQRINSELFTGKLKWVELEANPSLARYLRKRTPFGKDVYHRQLPVFVPAPVGHKQTQVAIHITASNVAQRGPATVARSAILEKQPVYFFWGIPEDVDPPTNRRSTSDVYFYGAAYFDSKDIDAVDPHLHSFLDQIQGHVRVAPR